MHTPHGQSQEYPIGNIQIEDYLPDAFVDSEIVDRAQNSIDQFAVRHGKLPLKFEIEQFCFQRPEQICTVDSPRKYLAWDSNDTSTTDAVLNSLQPKDFPLVLRSHPIEYGTATPVIQLSSQEDVEDYLGSDEQYAIHQEFFQKIDREATVVQLLKNPYLQKGLFLCRPTFIYDEKLRQEVQTYQASDPQYVKGKWFAPGDMTPEFAGIRVLALADFAREKKDHMGAFFAMKPETGCLEARDGFPVEAKFHLEGEFKRKGRIVLGRTLDMNIGSTTLHYKDGERRISPDSSFIAPSDLAFLSKVLNWQLPRIAAFEKEIRAQEWIPQGLSNTHQFVVLPQQELDKPQINTQYFDCRPHADFAEMERLSSSNQAYSSMPTEQKILKFY